MLTDPWAECLASADEALEDGDLAAAVQWAQVAQAHALASIAETLRDREVLPARTRSPRDALGDTPGSDRPADGIVSAAHDCQCATLGLVCGHYGRMDA